MGRLVALLSTMTQSGEKRGLKLEELGAQHGANLMASTIGLIGVGQVAYAVFSIIVPYCNGFNAWPVPYWLGLTFTCVFAAAWIVCFAIGMLAPGVRGTFFSVFTDSAPKPTGIARSVAADMITFCLTSFMAWCVVIVPYAFYIHEQRTTVGATYWLEDLSFGMVTARGVLAYQTATLLVLAATVLQFTVGLMITMRHFVKHSPAAKMNMLTNIFGKRV